MNMITPRSPGIERLAQLLEEDIHRRELRSGERYLTSDEAGKQFGVSRATAHRAFQILADRQLLVSKPRLGTFVGPAGVTPEPTPELHCVHVIVDPERLRAGLSTGELVDGLRAVLPEYDLQINYLPATNATGYVSRLLRELTTDREDGEHASRRGLVLFGCPRRVQEMVAASGVPAVIFGSRYPTASAIPSISVDNVAKGRVLTRYLLDRGHRKIGVIMRETWLPGDRRVFEGINQELAAAGLPYGTLSMRNVPNDQQAIVTELNDWLRGKDAPTALICQQRFADAVAASLRQLGYRIPDDLELVIETTDHCSEVTLQLPHTCSQVAFFDRVKRAGELLAQVFGGKTQTSAEILPITLAEPSRTA